MSTSSKQKYNQGEAPKADSKAVPWWDGPKPGGKVDRHAQAGGLPGQAGPPVWCVRVTARPSGCWSPMPGKIALSGGGDQSLALRRAEAAPRHHRVLPEGQCPPGEPRARWPPSSSSERHSRRVPPSLAGAGGVRALFRHQLSRPHDSGHSRARACAPNSTFRTRDYGWIVSRILHHLRGERAVRRHADRPHRAEPRHQPGGRVVVVRRHRHRLHPRAGRTGGMPRRARHGGSGRHSGRRQSHPSVSAAGGARLGNASTRRA